MRTATPTSRRTTTNRPCRWIPSSSRSCVRIPITQYQDVFWALLFVAHLIAMIVVIVLGMTGNNNAEGGGGEQQASVSSGTLFFLIGVTGLAAIGLSASALSFMMNHTEKLVQTALIFSVATSLAIGILGFVTGSMLMGGLGLLSFAIGLCYAKIVWPRIPFAAANLNTALTCVRLNLGLSAVSFLVTAVAFAWTVLWFLGVGSALQSSNSAVLFALVRFDRLCRRMILLC